MTFSESLLFLPTPLPKCRGMTTPRREPSGEAERQMIDAGTKRPLKHC
jgi:hypothetical protein